MVERFIENVNYLSLPDKILYYHLGKVVHKIVDNTNYREELETCYENVFGNGRGKSVNRVETFKKEFTELMKMNGEYSKISSTKIPSANLSLSLPLSFL